MFDELQNYDYGPRYLSSPPGRGPLGRAPIVRRAVRGSERNSLSLRLAADGAYGPLKLQTDDASRCVSFGERLELADFPRCHAHLNVVYISGPSCVALSYR